jgi:hypothetical protein
VGGNVLTNFNVRTGENYSDQDETVRSTSVRRMRQGDQRGGRGSR